MEQTWQFFSENIIPHWPFLIATLVFTVVGRFSSRKLFTRKRAYTLSSGKKFQFWKKRGFWWWGRETLSLHPILTGLILGLLWVNPEEADPALGSFASMGYFAGSGVLSLFAWSILTSVAKKKGVVLSLPGESVRPGESPPDHMPDLMPEE